MGETAPGRWSAAEQDEIWARWQRGESFRAIGRHFGTHLHAVRRFVARTGGCRRLPPGRAEGALTAAERVSRGLAADESYRALGRRLGRAHTTIARVRGRSPWRATAAPRTIGRAPPTRPRGAAPSAPSQRS